ncbi:hypothetical protein CRL705_926 [Latilactobacillus curvatus CRL 705]|nr:hypothetical protein CRL705_926 [Latilactobacillus curvatus CRL 705]
MAIMAEERHNPYFLLILKANPFDSDTLNVLPVAVISA